MTENINHSRTWKVGMTNNMINPSNIKRQGENICHKQWYSDYIKCQEIGKKKINL